MRKFWRKRSVAETDNYKAETEEENVDACSENVERGKYILIGIAGLQSAVGLQSDRTGRLNCLTLRE